MLLTARWEWDKTKPTRNRHGITGWATVNGESQCRVHVCAHNPCTAKHAYNSKYGFMPVPIHGRISSSASSVVAAPLPLTVLGLAPSAVAAYLLASGAADRRTRARVVADEWCSLTHLVMKIPLDIIVIVLGSFDFQDLCKTWLDPHHHTDISAEVARWHDQNKDNTCPTSFAFRYAPKCPGWILCCCDYTQLCRWEGRRTTPRIIALQYHEECGGQLRIA